MGRDEDRSDLWKDAWSRPEPPAEAPLRPREQWSPGSGRDRRGDAPANPRRRRVEIDARNTRPRDEAPAEHRPPLRSEARRPHAGARALAPRGTVVGYRRGRRRAVAAALILLAVLALAGAAALAWWFGTRPAALAITAAPSDATVTIAGHGTRKGTFVLEGIDPGTITAVVARSGFATQTVSVQAERGTRTERAVSLQPRSFKLSVTSRPAGASVTVTRSDGTVRSATTPCSLATSAGAVTVTIAKSGSNTFTQAMFVDGARQLDVLLDPKGQLVHSLGSLTAKGAPKSVAVTPNGREAWAAILNGPPSIEIYDLQAMKKIAGIDLGKYGAVEVVFNRAGTRAYASQMETARVFEIDTATRKVRRSFATKSAWTKVVALSPDEKTLYAANWSGNDVSVIDLVSGKLERRIPVAKTPRGLWPTADGRYLYVAGFAKGDLQRVDLRTGKVRTLFVSGGAMRHLVADEKTGKLYASDMAKNVVWVTDMVTLKTRRFCTTDKKPNTIKLSPDGSVLFVSNRGENNPRSYYLRGYEWGTILLMSTATGRPLDAIVGGNQCTALDVSQDGRTLVFSDFLDNRLRVYSVPTFDALAAGNGGRYAAHFAALKKSRP
jgi:YVTN family beta-propeller protein